MSSPSQRHHATHYKRRGFVNFDLDEWMTCVFESGDMFWCWSMSPGSDMKTCSV